MSSSLGTVKPSSRLPRPTMEAESLILTEYDTCPLLTSKLFHLLILLFKVSYVTLALFFTLLQSILNTSAKSLALAQDAILSVLLMFLGVMTTLLLAIANIESIYYMVQERKRCPATAFTLFPDLPVEIRRMIWRAALTGPQIVAFKEVHTGSLPHDRTEWAENIRSTSWMTTFGCTGSVRTVCKEANEEALGCKLPPFIDVDMGFSIEKGSELRKRDFEAIWLINISCLQFLEDYWCAKEFEKDLPRRLAISLSTWKLQISDIFVSQLLLRIRRFRICEIFVVVGHDKLEDTLIRFVAPKKDPSRLKMNSRIMSAKKVCVKWSDFEALCRAKLQDLNARDVKDKEKYYLEGGDTTQDLEHAPQYKSFRMWREWTAPQIRCVEAKFIA